MGSLSPTSQSATTFKMILNSDVFNVGFFVSFSVFCPFDSLVKIEGSEAKGLTSVRNVFTLGHSLDGHINIFLSHSLPFLLVGWEMATLIYSLLQIVNLEIQFCLKIFIFKTIVFRQTH
jgi:hypothetical protein